MKRRDFIIALGGAAVAWPFAANAQKLPPVVAILGSGAADANSSRMQMSMLDAGMRELGLVAGRDFIFEERWAGSDAGRFPALAAELLALDPAAVVVSTNLAALAVQKLSRNVAIVGTGLNAPVATGLAASLNRPGGNITGVATMAEDVLLKLFEFMRETLPGARRVIAVVNPTNPSHPAMLDLLRSQAVKQGVAVDAVRIGAPADLDAAFAEISSQPPGALLVLTDNSLFALSEPIIARALALRVPTFGGFAGPFAQGGALFAYSRNPREAFQGVARLLRKVLGGAAPAELPFEQPTKFDLFVNLKTAKALGIEIPPALLATATEVIE
jgi:putative ABC transport system substrate-binding protein